MKISSGKHYHLESVQMRSNILNFFLLLKSLLALEISGSCLMPSGMLSLQLHAHNILGGFMGAASF